MIDAGLTIETALRTLDKKEASAQTALKKQARSAMPRIIGLVARGQSLSNALKQAKCINKSDYTILNIAESAGKLPLGLLTISKRRRNWLARVQSLKAGLLLPKGLLLLGAFAGLLIRTAGYQQPLLSSLVSVLGTLVLAWALIAFTVRLVRIDSLVWLSLAWPLRFIRQNWVIYTLAFEDVFYRLLAWQISAGVAPDKALVACGSLLSSRHFNQSTLSASKEAGLGDSMPNVLVGNDLVLSDSLKRVLITSVEIGSWDGAVLNHLKVQHQYLSLKADDFFKWLPRLFYLIALVAVSKCMLV